MKNNWPVKKLGEILSFEYGSGLPERNRIPGNFPVFGSNGEIGFHNEKLVNGPGIIIGRKGSIGEIIWSDVDFWPIDTTYFAKLNSNEDLKFIYYLLSTLNLKMLNKASGVPGLNRNDVYSLSVSLPAISYQKKIVERLGAIRKAQELCDQQIQKTEELFESIINKEIVKRISNWNLQEIREFAVMVGSGSTPRGGSSVYVSKGIQFIRSQNVGMLDLDFSDIVFIDKPTHEKMKRTKVFPKDVLLNITGASIGRVAIYPENYDEANVNQHVCIIRVDANKILSNFLEIFLATKNGQDQILRMQSGGTRQGLNFEQVKDLKIPIPSIADQQRIVKKIEVVQDYKKLLQKQKILFKELFDSVLDKSMKGEMDN